MGGVKGVVGCGDMEAVGRRGEGVVCCFDEGQASGGDREGGGGGWRSGFIGVRETRG